MNKSLNRFTLGLLAVLLALSVPTFIVKAQDTISLQDAIAIAQGLYPSAKVVKTEFVQATPPYYVIGLDNGKSVYINATSKEIVQITTAQTAQAPSMAGVPLQPIVPVVPPAGSSGAIGALISFEQARQIAQQRFPNTQVIDAKLERMGRRHGYAAVWEIKLNNGYEVKVNATSGAIVEIKLMKKMPLTIDPAAAAISQAQAEQIAVSNFGSSALFSRLKREGAKHGYALVWEVLLSNGYKVKVNANTGSIFKVDYRW